MCISDAAENRQAHSEIDKPYCRLDKLQQDQHANSKTKRNVQIDILVFDAEKSETVVPDLKKYLDSGWTFFALANFCEGGCGHYFWITDIDNKDNIWAYDPAYGRYEIPYNENSRYPFPLYRLAFGVKK